MKQRRNRQIAMAAMLCGIYVIATMINTVLPIEIFIIIFLPVYSAYIYLKSDFSVTIAFAFATILLTALIDINTSLLYVVPCVLNGFLFAFLLRLKFSSYYLVVMTAVGNFCMLLFTNWLVTVLYNVNLISTMEQLLGHDNQLIIIVFAAAIALSQAFLTFFIAQNELSKLGIKIAPTSFKKRALILPSLIFPLGFIPFLHFSIVCSALFVFFTLPLLPMFYKSRQWVVILIIQVSSFFVSLPLFLFLPENTRQQIYLIPFFLTLIYGFLVKIENRAENFGNISIE